MLAQFGMGYVELDRLIKDPQALRFTFELLSVLEPRDYEASSWQLADEEKMASIPELKSRANTLFNEQKYDSACSLYSEALTRLDSVMLQERPGSEDWDDMDRKKALFYGNIAQCKLAQADFYACISACDEVLQRDANNAKALYRRAKANGCVWNFEAAREDWSRLSDHHPTMAATVKTELQKLAQVERTKNAEASVNFKNLFAS
jgi:tetratricopeptide (TPR) repeat protein